MPRWRILIPVLIVAIVGVIAYVQIAPKQSGVNKPPANSDQQEGIINVSERPLGVSGDETIDTQADIMVNELLRESSDDQTVEGDGSADVAVFNSGESDQNILDVEYYAE